MNEPTSWAAIAVALITGVVTVWTQRGGARAQRRSALIDERSQGLREFKVLREAAMEDLASVRAEVAVLREDVREAHDTLLIASEHIRVLRPMVPVPPGPPALPDRLRQYNIGS